MKEMKGLKEDMKGISEYMKELKMLINKNDKWGFKLN